MSENFYDGDERFTIFIAIRWKLTLFLDAFRWLNAAIYIYDEDYCIYDTKMDLCDMNVELKSPFQKATEQQAFEM